MVVSGQCLREMSFIKVEMHTYRLISIRASDIESKCNPGSWQTPH